MSHYAEFETIKLSVADGIARLTFNRPEVLNAWNRAMIEDTRAALALLVDDLAVRVLIMTGEGRGFSAGADLAAGFGGPKGMSTGDAVAYSMDTGFNPLAMDIANFPRPVIAAVNGICAGGGVGVALSADIVVAARSAYFVQVFGPKLGIVPDVGSTYHVPRLVGKARARGLALLGDKLPAETAEEWGMIWKCVDDEALAAEVDGLAERLAEGPTKAFGYIKKILDASEKHSLSEQLALERDYQNNLANSEDFAEGVTAFLQKRKPQF